jgi:hypothetical protein
MVIGNLIWIERSRPIVSHPTEMLFSTGEILKCEVRWVRLQSIGKKTKADISGVLAPLWQRSWNSHTD